MTVPLVSVIIATKNRANYLGQAIDSVFAQEYSAIELIVVDGGSTDHTQELVHGYKNIHYLLQDKDHSGIAAAWNLGISAARGEFIAFIDSDDLWHAKKLVEQMNMLQQHPHIDYVITKVKYFLQSGCAVPAHFRKSLLEGEYTAHLPQALLARKKLFQTVGLFDEHYAIGNDTDWFVRAKDLGVPMAITPTAMLYKRVHADNTSVANIAVNHQELLSILRSSIHRTKDLKKTSEEVG